MEGALSSSGQATQTANTVNALAVVVSLPTVTVQATPLAAGKLAWTVGIAESPVDTPPDTTRWPASHVAVAVAKTSIDAARRRRIPRPS